MQPSGACDGSYLNVLRWGIRGNWGKCTCQVAGFLCIASGGEGWLKSQVMSVGPQLLICLPMGTAVWCAAGAS